MVTGGDGGSRSPRHRVAGPAVGSRLIRWREWTGHCRHILGGLRLNLQRIAQSRRDPGVDQVELLAHIILASVSEVAMHIARADNQAEALNAGQAALDLLLDGLVEPSRGPSEPIK